MYTVVLMAAMASGPATHDFHPHGGGYAMPYNGSCVGCYGCFGMGGFNGGGPAWGGSCVGTYGGYSVAGPNPAYGCWGYFGTNSATTIYDGASSYGYGHGHGVPGFGLSFQCHGCYGCYGGWSCFGSPLDPRSEAVNRNPAFGGPSGGGYVPPAPTQTVPPTTPMPSKDDKQQSRVRSKVIIEVPENARLFVDGNEMKPGPTTRVFQTPPLDPGQTYFYEVRVDVAVNGKVQSDTRRLVINPGETVTAAFREPGRPEVVTVREGGE